MTFPRSGWWASTWPVTARRRLDRSGCEKGGKQHAMRVIKGSPRRQARAGDRTQGRSAADSDFVFGDLAPLTRRRSQRKRLPSAIEPITKPTFQCARGTSHTAANSSNSIETSARRPQPKPCGGGGCRIYLCDLASLVASCGTARGSPAPPPKPCGGGGAWSPHLLHRGSGGSMYTRKAHATRETPTRDQG